MKWFKGFILFVGMIFLLTGGICDKKSTVGPDFSDDSWDHKYHCILLFDTDDYIMVNSNIDFSSSSLKVEGIDFDLEWLEDTEDWDEDGVTSEWWADIDLDDLGSSLNIVEGGKLNFELTLDDKAFSGNITVPYTPVADFPSDFDFDSDFKFTWSLDKSPETQWAYLNIIDYDWDDLVDKAWHLDAGQRKLTITKKNYDVDEEDVSSLWIGIEAVNYVESGKMFAMAYGEDTFEYENWGDWDDWDDWFDWKAANNPASLRSRRLKKLMQRYQD